jgi:tripartite-type tricarboxylate transporter receptor subunit TctC
LPDEVVNRIFTATRSAAENPEVVKSLRNVGGEVMLSASPKEFLEFSRDEAKKWAQVVKDSGAQVN